MQVNLENFHRELVEKAKLNKHLLVGYLFLTLVFMGAISSVYYWEYKAEANRVAEDMDLPRDVGSGEQAGDDDVSCIQVITRARNRVTGEVRDFPTPCDIQGNWEIWEVHQ